MPKLSITSVNYNGEKFIAACLDSIQKQTFQDFEMLIVDNASADCSAKIIEEKYPSIKLIKNDKNLGYCKAQNQAIRVSRGEYILTLNLDLILERDFLEQMIKAIESHSQIGSVAPKLFKLKNGQKTKIIDSVGHLMEKNRNVKNIGEGEPDHGQYDDPKFIFGVSGSAALHRRKMLEEIKWGDEYLDEDFVSGLDDIDIDWRAKLLGWKTYYCPQAVGYHIRGGSTGKFSDQWRFYNYRNRYLMLIKNDSLTDILLDIHHLLLYELGMLFSMIIQFQIFRVVFDIICLLPKFLRKRRDLQSRRRVSEKEIRKWFK